MGAPHENVPFSKFLNAQGVNSGQGSVFTSFGYSNVGFGVPPSYLAFLVWSQAKQLVRLQNSLYFYIICSGAWQAALP